MLRNNLQFANGNAVTAEDVVYSCNKARSTSRFSAGLANIASVSGDKNTVVFQLKTADPLFVNLLDFPIVKKDTGDQDLPIGSGRYVAQMTETTAKLVYNTKHFRGNTPKQTEISVSYTHLDVYKRQIRDREAGARYCAAERLKRNCREEKKALPTIEWN